MTPAARLSPEQRTQFDYLLECVEQASQHADPATMGYTEKRQALFAYVSALSAPTPPVEQLRELNPNHPVTAAVAAAPAPPEAIGTSVCPICNKSYPHQHSADDLKRLRPTAFSALIGLRRCRRCKSADLIFDGIGYKCVPCSAYNEATPVCVNGHTRLVAGCNACDFGDPPAPMAPPETCPTCGSEHLNFALMRGCRDAWHPPFAPAPETVRSILDRRQSPAPETVTVTRDQLRALTEKWRDEANRYPESECGEYGASATRLCANELDALTASPRETATPPVPAVMPPVEIGDWVRKGSEVTKVFPGLR